jgi:hypothetical protein
MQLSGGDLATLSLLDPDQGVCPNGHPCRLDDRVGYRRCSTCDYDGLALICWSVTFEAIMFAERAGAAIDLVEWARLFLANRV